MMYLVVCKSKVTGLSIEDGPFKSKQNAESLAKYLNDMRTWPVNTYHVVPFDLATIDLEKLMEGVK